MPPKPSRASTWIAEGAAVFAKDWRCELRTRYALNTIVLFALTTLVLVTLSLGPVGIEAAIGAQVLPVILWLILLFAAAAGLPRSFVHEEESGTAIALRLAATPSALFCGKLAYSLSLLLALELIVVPLFAAMAQLSVASTSTLVLALVTGGYGLAAGSTLVAAIVSQARGKAALFAVLAFPVLIPLLLLAVELTRSSVTGEPSGDTLRQLLLYDATVTVGGLMLFPSIWNP